MAMRENKSDILRNDYPFYRPVWNRAVFLAIGPLALIFAGMGAWVYTHCSAPAGGFMILVLGFVALSASVIYHISALVERLEKKRLNIHLLDQQLLKMSRMAATTKLTRDFLEHFKDVLINIDSTAEWARSMGDQNNPEAFRESVFQIKAEATRAHQAIDKLLSFTRLPGNQWVIQDINPNELIADLLELFAGEFSAKGICLQKSLQKRLPGIRSNFSRLYQVIQNLLLAAVSDIEQDGELTVRTAAVGEGVRIEVIYPSRHFDQHVITRLADPAYALQSREPGPWLALCLYHAHRVNGRVQVESADPGLKFTVTLPYEMNKPSGPPPSSFLKGL